MQYGVVQGEFWHCVTFVMIVVCCTGVKWSPIIASIQPIRGKSVGIQENFEI